MTASVKPLFEDASAPVALRELVEQARADGPSEADLRRLAAHIMLVEGALQVTAPQRVELGSPPPGVAAPDGTVLRDLATQPFGRLLGSTMAKVMASLGLTVIVGLGWWGAAHGPIPSPSSRSPAEPRASAPRAESTPRVAPTAALPSPLERAPAVANARAVAPVPETAPGPTGVSRAETDAPAGPSTVPSATQVSAEQRPAQPHADASSLRSLAPGRAPTELELITQAEAARANVAQALSLLALHQRLYRHGVLAQEREALAIEVLVRGGEVDRAKARARRFAETYPQSAHGPRVRALIARIGSE